MDMHPGFLATLRERADAAGVGARVATVCASMAEVDVAPGSVDLIWSEGAVFVVGFEAGLRVAAVAARGRSARGTP